VLLQEALRVARETSQKVAGDHCQQKGDSRVTSGSSADTVAPPDPVVNMKKKDHQKDRAVEQRTE